MRVKNLSTSQRKRLGFSFCIYVLIAIAVLTCFTAALAGEKAHTSTNWSSYLSDPTELAAAAGERGEGAARVLSGTYVENLREINLKNSCYRVEFLVWFRWDGDADLNMADNFRVYKGIINSKRLVKEVHDGGENYQLVSVDATVSKSFDTKRFPLESHQLRFYVESQYPVEEVVLTADKENSGFNPNLSLTGYDFKRCEVGAVSFEYESTHADPELTDSVITSEIVTMFEINRTGFGLYIKCFIALYGAILWALIALYLCGYHRVDPLSMIPGALFGAASNIMIGASLLPDSLETGLLEYANVWGLITILSVAIAIININRIRSKYEDHDFAKLYGRIMFAAIFIFTILGQLILPLSAYIR